jgi:hypothetical protein
MKKSSSRTASTRSTGTGLQQSSKSADVDVDVAGVRRGEGLVPAVDSDGGGGFGAGSCASAGAAPRRVTSVHGDVQLRQLAVLLLYCRKDGPGVLVRVRRRLLHNTRQLRRCALEVDFVLGHLLLQHVELG